jgi:hypothetical protein
MNKFPRTTVGGVSVSRMIIGTNWFLGYSHTTDAKDTFIKDYVKDRKRMADIIEVFFRAGVDTIMGLIDVDPLADAIKDAEDRTGVKGIIVTTPGLPFTAEAAVKGFDLGQVEKVVASHAKYGSAFFLPHQSTTDAMVDRCTRQVRHMAPVCRLIRQYKMIPGLSTHMPETIVYADETGLDAATYISLYNSMGFLMQVEVDWIAQIIRNAKQPVMTIKPMAAGQLRPFQALNFVWNTLRPQDMVTVGTMTPQEAAELVELSLGILEKQPAHVKLQETRSKATVKPKSS